MKRLLVVALGLLALAFSAFPVDAGVRWTWKEVGWRISRFENGSSTLPVFKDTTYAHVGAVGLIDSSQWVVMENCAHTSADSVNATTVAYWVFCSDTSAIYTASLTAITVATDVGPVILNNNGAGHPGAVIANQAVAAIDGGTSMLVATGNKVVAVPINIGGGPSTSVGGNLSGLAQSFPIRCRITAAVGAQGLAQARVFIVYPTDR